MWFSINEVPLNALSKREAHGQDYKFGLRARPAFAAKNSSKGKVQKISSATYGRDLATFSQYDPLFNSPHQPLLAEQHDSIQRLSPDVFQAASHISIVSETAMIEV